MGDEYGLRLYSFEESTATGTPEIPSPPVHIATFLFPPLVADIGARITLKRFCRAAYSGEPYHQPFTTSKEAFMITAAFPPTFSFEGELRRYSMFIQASTFTSPQVAQTRARNTQPESIQWASWGPKSTRLMPCTGMVVSFGCNVSCEGNQFNFNQLDIARDLHRAKTSSQDPRNQSMYLETFLDQNTPTTAPAGEIFREDVSTYLPFRRWHARSPGSSVIPAEDWVYVKK